MRNDESDDTRQDDTDSAPEAPDENLGLYLKSLRLGQNMTLRDVEEATDREISNAYLSQIETGKVTKPSPHILYALSEALGASYMTLMERAGYLVQSGIRDDKQKPGRAPTYSIDNLTVDEERTLLDYLNYVRSKKG